MLAWGELRIKKAAEVANNDDVRRTFYCDVWVGMSEKQLVVSLGNPEDKKETVHKNGTKNSYFYEKHVTKRGRIFFNKRFDLENGVVVGWKDI